MSNELASTIYDHYKDTCSIIAEAIKRRDRLMLFLIATLGFFALQGIFPSDSIFALNEFLNFKFGVTLTLNLWVIGNIVWFLLLIFTLRYFQIAVFVERQYSYIHKIEDQLNEEFGKPVILREGKSYLSDYPYFSDWMWFLYTVAFPALLLIVTIVKIGSELKSVCTKGWSFGLGFDVIIFILLAISVVLYLGMIHGKKN